MLASAMARLTVKFEPAVRLVSMMLDGSTETVGIGIAAAYGGAMKLDAVQVRMTSNTAALIAFVSTRLSLLRLLT